MTTSANLREAFGRERKAQRLARRAVEALIVSATDEKVSAIFWRQLLEASGFDHASEETRKRVVEILRMLRPVKQEGWSDL